MAHIPNPNYHLTFVGWSYQQNLSTPGFLLLFSGAWGGGAKVINRQGHASLPSFSALPFKMPRFTSIGTCFRWKNIKPAWNTWNSMICWLSHLTSLMYLSHLVYPLPVPPIFLDDFCIFCGGQTRPKHPFFLSAARAWSGPCQFLRQCSRLPGVKAWIMPRSNWARTLRKPLIPGVIPDIRM